MSIHILVDAAVLARSRFAFSPVGEVVGALRQRHRPPSTPPGTLHHTAQWNQRAALTIAPAHLALLHALVPVDAEYAPDFLTPRPASPWTTVDEMLATVAQTPEEIVEYHLDIGLAGRPVRPEVAAQFATTADYLAWRRPVPPALARVVEAGPRAVAEAAATALGEFCRQAVGDDWPLVRAVLEADVAHRGERISSLGWARMLAELGDLSWTGSELTVERSYEGVVDWADDGIVFVPSVAHTGRVTFCAERPDSPVITFAASGTAALWAGPQGTRRGSGSGHAAEVPRTRDVVHVIGRGRTDILTHLDRPRTTRNLARLDGRSESTISYHLGVLERAGLVDKRRDGGSVIYRRTELADSLVGPGPCVPEPGPASP